MTTDVALSILSKLYDTLTGDSGLQTAMGGTVALYPTLAGTDITMPYLVHRLDLRNITDWTPERAGTYIVDIWSDMTDIAEIMAIRKAIMDAIHNLDTTTAEVDRVWLWRQTDGFIADEPGIWHYVIQFNLKYLKLTDMSEILRR